MEKNELKVQYCRQNVILPDKKTDKNSSAFSLAEMMVVMLIMSIVLAALAPMITTRIKADQAVKAAGAVSAPQEDNNPWKWVEGSDTDAYSQASRNMIGQTEAGEDDGNAMLIFNKGKDDKDNILFKNSKGIIGRIDMWSSGSYATLSGLIIGNTTTGFRKTGGGMSIGFGNTMAVDSGVRGSLILGYENTINEDYSIAIGYSNTVSDSFSGAIGYSNELKKGYALGEKNTIKSYSWNNIAIGYYNNANTGQCYLFGSSNTGDGDPVHAFGTSNTLSGNFTMALGHSNTVTGTNETRSYAFGYKNEVSAVYSSAIGYQNKATATGSTSIGINSQAKGKYSLAIGVSESNLGSTAISDYSMAIGRNAKANDNYSVAIGAGDASGVAALAISGNYYDTYNTNYSTANAWGDYSTAIGYGSMTTGDYAVAIGGASANGKESLAISGSYSLCAADSTAHARGERSVAIGYYAEAKKDYDFALGCDKHNVQIPGTLTVSKTLTVNGTAVESDKRLKYIKGENKSGLDKIRQMKVYNFTFKKDQNKEPRVGVIAQELQKILPDAVKKGSDGFLTIRIDDIIYTLVNAVKELDRKVSELTETLKQVQAEQKRINQRLDALEHKSVH